eukprot:TRINITY_DN37489_c0_g1_i3.p1 TRINITY_DN37489_c0_g1~~TRINITY_DN37489_c0_g1_i3.p1  ORF type:complete len:389 (+),score=88.50 TRINITY_DN37489_c0_g1_i3:41-1168(+)
MAAPPNPGNIMQIATGFWASKVLLEAIDCKVFTTIAKSNEGSMSAAELSDALGWCHGSRPRAVEDFLNALQSLGFLQSADADGSALKRYSNAPDTDLFLDAAKPSYMGDFLTMLNKRLYGYWGNLGEALRTGKPQNEMKDAPAGANLWKGIYATPESTEMFCKAMASVQMGNYMTLCGMTGSDNAFADWFGAASGRTSVLDAGGSDATFAGMLAQAYPNLERVASMDIAEVASTAEKNVEQRLGVEKKDKVKILKGSFFEDILAQSGSSGEPFDIIVLGNILHDWDEAEKKAIMRRCYDALSPEKGMLVVVEMVMDDAKSKAVPAFLMSLNMLIETSGGFNFSHEDFAAWAQEVGYKKTDFRPVVGADGALVAFK